MTGGRAVEGAWGWAWLHYRSGRALAWALAGAGAAFLMAGRALAGSPEAAGRVYFGLAILLPMALALRAVSRDRRANRWLLIFQAPVTPLGHYLRVLALVFLLCSLLLTTGTAVLAGAAALLGAAASPLWPLLAAALLWSGVLALVTFAASALLPRGDGVVVGLYILASFLQVALLDDLGVRQTSARRAISWLLLPLDPMAEAWRGLTGAGPGPDPGGWAHIALFCAIWLAVACAALARLGRAEMPLRDG
ncbi:MAG TPA: hypothetical protein VMK65_00220 [Longimicrobiales bacterium]|nr:hypothetical protein [Longimicrobiales bacterium]